ncbi:MAG: DoxX family protein [Bacteroidetes bacterium]|nr:DoxX family protein [Bacteroidota bacterium]
MKVTVTICRWLVGLLFIFSGLVKANDPLGLSFKMLEFFEKWGIQFLDNYSLSFAIVINIIEVVAGVGIIIGWKPKFFTWLLLLLILFFTFLTSYVLFSGKIHACGCFGDCIPLTPIQTFTKDIILLVLIVIILFGVSKITTHINGIKAIAVLAATLVFVGFVEFYVLHHLPFKDCLAYKQGNNILEQMKPPVGSYSDSIVTTMKFNHNGKVVEIVGENYPADYNDTTYQFIEGSMEQKVVRKGNNTAKIANFSLTTASGNDTTQAILDIKENYVLIFVKDFSKITASDKAAILNIIESYTKTKIPIFIVTNDKEGIATSGFNGIPIFTCDATEIKTAARVNPTIFLMQGATILSKVAGVDVDDLMK